MWKNTVDPGRPWMTKKCMRTECWISKDTNTHSEYVNLIAFPLQRRLHERAPMSLYTYTACLVHVRTFNVSVGTAGRALHARVPGIYLSGKITGFVRKTKD